MFAFGFAAVIPGSVLNELARREAPIPLSTSSGTPAAALILARIDG